MEFKDINHLEKLILKYPDKPWDWYGISSNPNITFDTILKYPDKSWNWNGISRNPNITFDIILKYPNRPWDWDELSWNQFEKDKYVSKKIEKRRKLQTQSYNLLVQYMIPDISHIICHYI